MKYSIDISCNHCGNKSSITVEESQFGQVIAERCNYCGEVISGIRVPNEQVFKGDQISKPTYVEVNKIKQSYLKLIIEASEYNIKQVFAVKKEIVIIGRKGVTSKADIQIDTKDLSMSRQHVKIEKMKNGKYVIIDNSSINGTFLNGRRLVDDEEIFLENNCKINIGATVIITELSNLD